MIVPADVTERLDELTDDEIVAMYVDAGLEESYGRACVDILRGRIPWPVD